MRRQVILAVTALVSTGNAFADTPESADVAISIRSVDSVSVTVKPNVKADAFSIERVVKRCAQRSAGNKIPFAGELIFAVAKNSRLTLITSSLPKKSAFVECVLDRLSTPTKDAMGTQKIATPDQSK